MSQEVNIMLKKKGFTLVELLVVIAIIALLVSILLPTLTRAKDLARQAACGSGLSGIGKAMGLYAVNYDGILPKTVEPAAGVWTSPYAVSNIATNVADAKDKLFKSVPNNKQGCPTASMFLLIRKAFIDPEALVCPADSDGSAYNLPSVNLSRVMDINNMFNCSYSLSYAWGSTVNWNLTGQSGFVLMSDLSPVGLPGADPEADNEDGNSQTHGGGDGQNALTLGGAVKWGETNRMGIAGDNIFTYGSGDGTAPDTLSQSDSAGNATPANTSDSVMIFFGRWDPESP